ncbi:MAG: PQQ-binding-like beta-propeller repeat protein [Chloroherpetonaceae bacterium]|nr:PQQ-binding-like beta-propeller repeat protein [Chthonomonadaceae bacterium]MDW8208786.1 PQQ-binding-like beta-propeller repeat protein [Chloroherpetonaceae bacterium]
MRKAYRVLSVVGAVVAGIGLLLGAQSASHTARRAPRATGWLNWRGPEQTGVSRETGLPDRIDLSNGSLLWTMDMAGGGTPVIANGRLYGLGYQGQGPDLQEVLFCADAETGRLIWQHRFSDFLSDITYDRYAIGSPCIDAETGNVYALTSAGVFVCCNADGKILWQRSLMEELGRLTFTNGRTGGPTIEQDLVIVRGITSNWGGEGAAQDRLYAYDKKTGHLVWSCSPGAPPKDNVFARPFFDWREGKRVFYTGTGDGAVICANARTGEVIWRYPISAGGMNASVLVHKGKVISIHADENLDSSDSGRMTALRADATPKPGADGLPPTLDRSAEVWRNGLGSISSSPVLVGDRIYQVNKIGFLCAVDASTGRILWEHRLGPDQLHASPTYADGKLYIPIQNGHFFVIRPKEDGAEVLSDVQLAGRCIGAPAVWNGKVYVFSTEKLYCFGRKGNNPGLPRSTMEPEYPKPGPIAALQILPAEVTLRPGQKVRFTVRGVDANGFPTGNIDPARVTWSRYIPPTARVRSEMNASFNAQGELVADRAQVPSAGAWQASYGNAKGVIRGRVLPDLPLKEDFEAFELTETAPDGKFAYPPLPWIGARFKFDVREIDGNKVLAKTLDNIFFQRATVFFGHPEAKNYTFEADVMTDGNRRTRSTVGLVNQRYYIVLVGNANQLEVNSNQERIKATVPFPIEPKVWYRLKTRVDTNPDGSGVVRAKAWRKGETEPEKWTIEVALKNVHKQGAPGLFGFSPQSLFRCYIDNISVTPNA